MSNPNSSGPWRLKEALSQANDALAACGVADSRLEAELLLMHALGCDRAHLYLDLEKELPLVPYRRFRTLLQRRFRREPLAYILGSQQFYGLDFLVDPRVLIPRPETELLVDAALAFLRRHLPAQPCLVADIGTGCGCLAIALAHHYPPARVYATDISAEALEVARANCQQHGLTGRVPLLRGNLLEPLPEAVDLVVSNLPYVTEPFLAQAQPELSFEPRVALAAGADGLDMGRGLLRQAPARLKSGGALILEISPEQATTVRGLAQQHFPDSRISVLPDLSGRDRCLLVET